MNFTRLALPLVVVLGLTLLGCSKQDAPAKAESQAGVSAAQSYDTLATSGKGFAVGPLMAANPVYVLFDPQCPHCGHLWQAAQPLLGKVKFVWLPVSFINGKSTGQGAALLSAANPGELMSAHEASILANTGGIPEATNIAADTAQAIKKNTELFNSLGVASVPYLVAKNARTGQVVSNAGAMPTPALAAFLGVD